MSGGRKRGRPAKPSHFSIEYYYLSHPVVPSEWEVKVGQREVDELVRAMKEGKERELVKWIHAFYRTKYVPEKVLVELGVYVDG